MDVLVKETNRYQEFCSSHDIGLQPSPKMRQWTPVDVGELYVFFALLLLMPHVKKHVL